MIFGHKIKKEVVVNTFLDRIRDIKEENIETSSHSFTRFNEEQRKKYDRKFICDILLHETPFLVGIQNNDLWALFYGPKKEIWRVMIDLKIDKIYIVTFYKINREQVPTI